MRKEGYAANTGKNFTLDFDRKTWGKLTTPKPGFIWQDIIKTDQNNMIPGLGLESRVHSRV